MSQQFTITYQAYEDLAKITPSFPLLSWYVDKYDNDEEIIVSIEKFEIPASQLTDLTIPVRTDSRTAFTILVNPDSLTTNTSGSVTAKINGGSTLWSIKPRMILSEDVTALAVRNSNTTTAKEITVLKILISGTPVYIESPKIR